MGIDYGMGQSNIDHKTGIRYGIFPVGMFTEWFWEGVESVYGFGCPHCGHETRDTGHENRKCSACHQAFSRDDGWSEEPIFNGLSAYRKGKGKFTAWVDDRNDVWFTKSKYIYRANFASPCAPGAGYVDEIRSDGEVFAYGPDPEELDGEYLTVPQGKLTLVLPK